MGIGASVQKNEHDIGKGNLQRNESVRNQFHKEFGQTAYKMESQETASEDSSKDKQIGINPGLFRAKNIFMKSIKGRRPTTKNIVVKKQNNAALLKEIYRRMDPSVVTSDSKLIVGEIEIAVKYKGYEENLFVKICKAKKLRITESFGLPDPYVVVEMYAKRDPSEKIQRKTAVKENSLNPIFQEIVVFPLKEKLVAETRIRVSVWDKDTIGSDDFLGESVIELCKLDLIAGDIFSYNLHPRTDESITGEVEVSLQFNEPNMFSITLHQGYHLKIANNIRETSNPFARVYATGLPNKYETKVRETTLNPVWDDTFYFIIHSDEFSRRVIIINVLSQEVGNQTKRIGDIHIPLSEVDFSVSNERQRYCLEDLQNTPYTRSKWSEEGLSIEFREAMRAHAIYGYPKFLFKKQHQGKMLVSVQSEKARTKAKMVINNGIPQVEQIQM